jgi:hypothetical protein
MQTGFSCRASLFLITIAVVSCFWTTASFANSLDNFRAALLSQHPAADFDAHSLMDIFGDAPLFPALHYDSVTAGAGWTSALTGVYLGQSLAVAYSGDLSSYPGGPITWTSTGTFGIDSWTGSGMLLFSGTAASFQIDMVSNLQVGANTVVDSAIFSGTSTPNNVQLQTLSSSEILNGVTLDGHLLNVAMASKKATCSLDGVRGGAILNEWDIDDSHYFGTLYSAPEPSTIVFALTTLALAIGRRTRLLR